MSLKVDLSQRLAVLLNLEKGCLAVEEEQTTVRGIRRTLTEMKDVLYDKHLETRDSDIAYYVFRKVASVQDLPIFGRLGLRYDLTVLPPGNWGGEYPKTFGHLHEHTPTSVSEVFEVVRGEAHFLIQNAVKKGEVEIIEAGEGGKLAIPRDCLHLIINPTDQILVTSNIVRDTAVPNYKYARRMRGAACYELQGRRFVNNVNYPEQYHVTFGNVNSWKWGEETTLQSQQSIYDLLIEKPEFLSFLTKPTLTGCRSQEDVSRRFSQNRKELDLRSESHTRLPKNSPA